MFSLFAIFRTPSASDIRKEQLHAAQIGFVEHSSAAEHHEALASMYAKRIQRLVAETEVDEKSTPVPAADDSLVAKIAKIAKTGKVLF